jgi:hypothetical protein
MLKTVIATTNFIRMKLLSLRIYDPSQYLRYLRFLVGGGVRLAMQLAMKASLSPRPENPQVRVLTSGSAEAAVQGHRCPRSYPHHLSELQQLCRENERKVFTVAWRSVLLPAKCFTSTVSFGWHHLREAR